MPLPLQAVDVIFEKLAVAYGHRFMSLWDGLPIEDVKTDWSQVLDGMSQHALEYGLMNLPAGRPPDAREFRIICGRRPEASRQTALPDMAPRKVPEILREKIAQLVAPRKDGVPERVRWARNYVDRFGGEGQKLSFNQKEHLRAARRILELYTMDDGLAEAKADAQRKTDEALLQGAGHAPQ